MATEEKRKDVVGSVLVVGGGIAGIQASLDLADSGYYVHMTEKQVGHRRRHGPVGQNLSHQRLFHVRHFTQTGGSVGAI
jgi:2-polyprenyl-6-methoxyphenol hydroxylase-like FAD-dependent oxidoreductase